MAAKTKSKKPGITSASKAKKVSKPKAERAPRVTMASTAYELIQAGKTNDEVRAVLKKQFSLPESHDYYPSWYRSHLVQKGIITKEWARENSGEPVGEEKAPKVKKAAKKAPKSASKKTAPAKEKDTEASAPTAV